MNKLAVTPFAALTFAATVALSLPAPAAAQQAVTRDLTQLDVSATPRLNAEQIRLVQQALQKKGVPPGPIDGIFGPLTKEALRRFQDNFGISTRGDLNNQTLFALGVAELAGPAQ